MRILIAEDDPVSRRLLEARLQKWGHEVTAATNGREAWEEFQAERFPVVISDWMMPEMDGLELVHCIRAARGPGYVYIVLLTVRSGTDDLVAGLDAGADDFLAKPFQGSELQARLRVGERILTLERDLEERNARLATANRRMSDDLRAAAGVQQSLLPATLPESSGARFAWAYRPCDEMAGDILNVVRLAPEQIGLYVVDVSGHGVAAALMAVAVSRQLVPQAVGSPLLVERGSGPLPAEPVAVAAELNRRFPMEENAGQYFTLLYGVLDTAARSYRFTSAGHPGPAHVPARGKPRLLQAESPAIGWLDDANFDEQVVQLERGDRLYVFSDGVTEAISSAEEPFGNERLLETLRGSRGDDLQTSVDRLLEAIEAWCGPEGAGDDLSVVALEITD